MCGNYKKNKRNENMDEVITEETYKRLDLSTDKIKEISVAPKVKDGKILFNKNDKDHRYIVDDK